MATTTRATHVVGGEITYSCAGPNTFDITLNLFRDCSGATLGNTQTVNFSSNCGGSTNLVVNLANIGGTEVSQLCAAQLPMSTCNGGALQGMQIYTYEGQIVLAPPCNTWTMSWSVCCRNTTVNLPGQNNPFLSATINSASFPCNSSPIFTAQPTPYVCNGVPASFNVGVVEPDGDSLVYALQCAQTALGVCHAYNGPYTALQPIVGMTIDPASGQLNFTPTTNGNFTIVVKVTEYDAFGNIKGTTFRDFQIVVQSCTNNPPANPIGSITNLGGGAIQTGPYSIQMCQGASTCFDVTFSDPDATDTLSILSNVAQVFPGGNFIQVGVNPAVVTVCFTAPGGAGSFSSITVNADDGGCPVPGILSQTISVTVISSTVASNDVTICGAQTAPLSVTGGTIFNWVAISGPAISVPANFSCNPCANPVASPVSTTAYQVTSNLAGGCRSRDTVVVSVVPDFTYSVAQSSFTSCQDDSVRLTASPNGPGPWGYTWSPAGLLSSSIVSNPYVTQQTPGTYQFTVDITSPAGCTIQDSLSVTVLAGQAIFADAYITANNICVGDTTTVWATCVATLPPGPLTDNFDPIQAALWGSSFQTSIATSPCGAMSGNTIYANGNTAFNRFRQTVALNTVGCTIFEVCAFVGNVGSAPGCGNVLAGFSPLLQYSTNGGGSWTTMFTFDQAWWDANNNWQCFSITIPPAARTAATLFMFTQPTPVPNGLGVQNWAIDNINIVCPPVTNCTYTWSPGIGNFNNAAADSTFAIPSDSTWLVVDVVDLNTGCTASDSVYVEVPSCIVCGIDAGPDVAICSGDTAFLVANTLGIPPCGVPTYSWTAGPTIIDPDSLSTGVTPVATTMYWIDYDDGCGCTARDSLTVTVTTLVADAGVNKTICAGDSVLIGGPGNFFNGANYSWDNGGGSGIVAGGSVGEYVQPGATTVYTVTISGPGCTNATDNMTVTVRNPTNADAGTDQTICIGSNVNIGGAGNTQNGYNYSWNNGAGMGAVAAGLVTANVSPAVTTTYTLTVSDPLAVCPNDVDMVDVTVRSRAVANAGNNASICLGSSTNLGGPGNAINGYNYSWNNGGGMGAVAGGLVTSNVSPVVTTVYTLTVSDPTAVCPDSLDQVTITVVNPTAADAGADVTICPGASTNIGGPGNLQNGYNYSWNNGAGMGAVAGGLVTANVSPGATTTYTLTVSDPLAVCPNSVDMVTVTVGGLPVANAGNNVTICQGASTNIGGPGNGSNGYNYSWNNGGGMGAVAGGLATVSVSPAATTVYTLTVSDPGAVCPDSVDQVTVTVINLAVADAGSDVTICAGGSTNIGGAGNSQNGYTYLWNNAAGSGTVAGGLVTANVTPGATTTYTVTISDTTGTCPDSSDQVTVTVGGLPIADAGANKTICFGDSIDIGGAGNLDNGYNYIWSGGAGSGSIAAGLVTERVSPAVTTVYTLTVSDPSATCADSLDQMTVSVRNPAVADAGSDVIICIGSSTNIGGPGNLVNGYNYSWNNAAGAGVVAGGLATVSVSPVVTTTYVLTISDPLGFCSPATDTVTVVVNGLAVANAGINDTICIGGSANIGGTGNAMNGYDYLWNNGAGSGTVSAGLVTESVSPAVTTVYTVTVSDTTGACPDSSSSVTIVVNPAASANAGNDTTICIGQSANIGGFGNLINGYNYSWNNAAGNGVVAGGLVAEVVSPIVTTTYTVTISDPTGYCPNATDAVVVNVNVLPIANAGATDSICVGGTYSLGGTGNGINGYNYSWDNGAGSGVVAGGLATGSASPTVTTVYTLTVSDPMGVCPDSLDQVSISTFNMTADAGTGVVGICPGDSIVIGGLGNLYDGFTYTWDNGGGTGIIVGGSSQVTVAPAATTNYTLIVSDAGGTCVNDSAFVTVSVNTGAFAAPGANRSICLGDSTQIGGVGNLVNGYAYSWNNGAGSGVVTAGSVSEWVSPAVTTTYRLIVADPFLVCSDTANVTVTVVTPPNANAGINQTICQGNAVNIGGPGNSLNGYTFRWDTLAGPNVATGLVAGGLATTNVSPSVTTTYRLIVQDPGAGCRDTSTMVVNVVTAPIADAGINDTICVGGSANIGGTNNAANGYNYSWNNGAGMGSVAAGSVTANVSPLVTTTYTVTVSDPTATCPNATDAVTIKVNTAPVANAGADVNICLGNATNIGGAGNSANGYNYSWDNGAGMGAVAAGLVTRNVSPAVSTTYTVTVSDPTGYCPDDTDDIFVRVITLPVADAGANDTICVGGNANIGGTGNSANGYNYSWNNGAGMGSVVAGAVTRNVSPAVTTTYTVTVSDTLAVCPSNNDAVTIRVNTAPIANAGADVNICLPNATNIGGTGNSANGYNYSWNNGAGMGSVAGGLVTRSVSPAVSTTYTLTVSDPTGHCPDANDNIFVRVVTRPVADAGVNDTICVGGLANIGGTTNSANGYNYSWNNGAGMGSVVAGAVTRSVSPAVTTTYTVTISDTLTVCPNATDAVTIRVNTAPIANAGADVNICLPNATNIGGAGNSANGYNYSWNNGAGMGAVAGGLVTRNVSPAVSTTYTLTVSDPTGHCPDATDNVFVRVMTRPVADAGVNDTICVGGLANIGGTTNSANGYNYSWNNGAGMGSVVAGAITQSVSPGVTTTYTVTISDTLAVCPNATDNVIIRVNTMPIANAGPDVNICQGNATNIGGAGNSANGYNYSWNNGAGMGSVAGGSVTRSVSPAVSTTYTVTVSDPTAHCPDDMDDVVVHVITPPVANAGTPSTICVGNSANIGGAGNSANGYNYSWNNAAGMGSVAGGLVGASVSPIATTTYTVTVSDTVGSVCANATSNVTVTVVQAPVADAGVDRAICPGGSTTIGGNANLLNNYLYSWNNGAGSGTVMGGSVAANVSPGSTTTYTVSVSDPGAICPVSTDMVTVLVYAPVDFPQPINDTICNGTATSRTIVPTGGNGTYLYYWDGSIGPQTQNFSPVLPNSPTTYTVRVTDSSSPACSSAVKSFQVFIHPEIVLTTNPSIPQIICPGTSIDLQAFATGGYPPVNVGWIEVGPGTAPFVGSVGTATPTQGTTTYRAIATDGCPPQPYYDVTVTWEPLDNPNFLPLSVEECVPFNVDFTNVTPLAPTTTVWWEFGLTNQFSNFQEALDVLYNEPGTYNVYRVLTSANGCIDTSEVVTVIANENPVADFIFGPQPTDINDPEINFTSISFGNSLVMYTHWYFDSLGTSTQNAPTFIFPDDLGDTYDVTLAVANEHNCVDTITKLVVIDGALTLYVPNAFTPDGDGINDYFLPVRKGIDPSKDYHFYIFNRWGREVFHERDQTKAWDGRDPSSGKKVQDGVYIWKLVFDDPDNGKVGDFTEVSGHVTVLSGTGE